MYVKRQHCACVSTVRHKKRYAKFCDALPRKKSVLDFLIQFRGQMSSPTMVRYNWELFCHPGSVFRKVETYDPGKFSVTNCVT
jgi:hypothetical protein